MDTSNIHNTIIIGSGPAGYSAAIYLARATLKPLLFSGKETGGQLMYTTEIENFPGFPNGIQGPELMMNMRKQAETFGTTVMDKHVTEVDFSRHPFVVSVGEEEYRAKSIIIATGATSIRLHVPGEDAFFGRGVSTCAVCDAAFYKDKKVFVIGGGDSAMEDALALAKFTDKVTVVHRRDTFRASKIMQQRVLNNKNIRVLWNTKLKEVKGNQKVEKVVLETTNNDKNKATTHKADGVFLAIGHKPVSEVFKDQVQLSEKGYVVTRLSLSEAGLKMAKDSLKDGRVSFPTMTSIDGVFAAGDIVDFHYQQAVTAAGMGVQASLDVERWLESN